MHMAGWVVASLRPLHLCAAGAVDWDSAMMTDLQPNEPYIPTDVVYAPPRAGPPPSSLAAQEAKREADLADEAAAALGPGGGGAEEGGEPLSVAAAAPAGPAAAFAGQAAAEGAAVLGGRAGRGGGGSGHASDERVHAALCGLPAVAAACIPPGLQSLAGSWPLAAAALHGA
jgi:hypothetical protein